MILLGEIRTHTNGAMMDLRGFQLLYDEKFTKGYTEHNQKLQKSIEELSSITRSKENKERLVEIAKDHKEWVTLNEPRVKIINENENLIHDPEFISSADGKKLQSITKESAEIYAKLMAEETELVDEMKKRISLRLITMRRFLRLSFS